MKVQGKDRMETIISKRQMLRQEHQLAYGDPKKIFINIQQNKNKSFYPQNEDALQVSYTILKNYSLTRAFLKQILAGEKQYYQKQEIIFFEVPQYEEVTFLNTLKILQLSVKNLYPKFKANEKVHNFLPDLDEEQLPERNFFFGIIGTVYTEWLKKVVNEALMHRNTKSEDKEKGEYVVVTEKFFKDLRNESFTSRNPGKGVYLLQKKILKRRMFKSRKKFPLGSTPDDQQITNPLQRKHLPSTQSTAENPNQSISNLSIRNPETDDEMTSGS